MTRTTRIRTCTSCGQKTITGIDADCMGIQVTLDHTPVDNLGEFLALAQGRRTYDLIPTRSYDSHGRTVEERNAWRIAHPWRMPYAVYTEHRCGQPLPAAPVKPTKAYAAPDRIIEGAPF